MTLMQRRPAHVLVLGLIKQMHLDLDFFERHSELHAWHVGKPLLFLL